MSATVGCFPITPSAEDSRRWKTLKTFEPPRGSITGNCEICSIEVWIEPGGQRTLRDPEANARIVCHPCILKGKHARSN